MKKRVILLGASRYYLRSIQAAQRAGYHVIAVDKNPEAPGLTAADNGIPCDISDREGVLHIARDMQINGVVPLNDYGVPTAAYVSSSLGLPGISQEAAEASTNKEVMRKKWLEAGVPCPKFGIAESSDEIRLMIESVGLPCILKPAHGIGGASRGVIVIQTEDEIERSIQFSQSFYQDKTMLIEQFVYSENEHSVEVLIENEAVNIIAVSDKIKTPLPYRVDKNVLYPSSLNKTRLEELKMVVKQSVQTLGINAGAAHVELASTEKGFVLFELGARCGGGGTPEPIVPFVTGVDLFVELVRILCGDPSHNTTPVAQRGCNYHFITLPPGRLKKVEGFEEVRKHPAVLDAELFVHPGQVIPEVTVGTERSGFIIVGGENAEEAYKNGCLMESRIHATYSNQHDLWGVNK